MIQFIVGLIIGAVIGGMVFFGTYAVCVAAKEEEDYTTFVSKDTGDNDAKNK